MLDLEALTHTKRSWLNALRVPVKCKGLLPDDVRVSTATTAIMANWATNLLDGKNMFAVGSKHCGDSLALYGSGLKTQLAIAVVTDILMKADTALFQPKPSLIQRPARFMSFSELIALKGKAIGGDDTSIDLLSCVVSECYDNSSNIRILILDNVGAEYASGSGWTKHIFMETIEARANKGLPTIVTTSVSPSMWRDTYGHTVGDLYDEYFLPVLVK